MIDKATVQKIKDTADIVEVVSDYVHLVRKGANYMGLCPFHNERTPSFSVNKAKNFCYCFSCHKGGSPINFIMEKEGVSYHDALLQLAKKYGIKVEERELTDEERENQNLREAMLLANEWATSYFESNLEKEEGQAIGLQYLYGRGVTPEAIRQFHLGYAIDENGDFLNAAKAKGFKVDILKSLGLVGTSQQGRDYDRFRGRVIFPVMNSSGKTIAFGGRDLKGQAAKYVNSPESDLYKKSNELYGIYQARNEIVRQDRCFLVEGYLDVIGMWQSGIKNVVASSGTSLTDGQISLIHRFTKNVTLIYDGDPAGIKASLRGIDMLLAHTLDVKVLLLPDGDDPDSFARKHTPEEFRKYISDNQTDIIRFKIKVLMDEAQNDPQKKAEAVHSVILSLAHIPDKVRRDIYIQECSKLLGVTEESILAETAIQREGILRQERVNRERNRLDRDIASGRIDRYPPASSNISQERINQRFQNSIDSSNITQENKTGRTENYVSALQNPLRPLELRLLEYCLKYGFLPLWEPAEDDEAERITVMEYVDEELSLDGIEFSDKDFSLVFNTLKELLPEFKRDFKIFEEGLTGVIEKKRKEGHDEIREKDLSSDEIDREEKKLEKRIIEEIARDKEDFCKNYISRDLCSHENEIIRNVTLEALKEKHRLSAIHSREKVIQRDEDRLISLVLNALNVLKNGILDMELNDLMTVLRNKTEERNDDEEKKIHQRISEILHIRNQMAKDIGERIICPKR